MYSEKFTNYTAGKREATPMRLFKKMSAEQLFPIFESDGDPNSEIYDYLTCVIKLDIDGNLITYNQAFSKQYGYQRARF